MPDVQICKQFFRIPDRIATHPHLKASSKIVYAAMLAFQGNRECCFASFDKIAKRSGESYPTVQRAVQELLEHHCIEPILDPFTLKQLRFRGGYKLGKTNVYRCLYVIKRKVQSIRGYKP